MSRVVFTAALLAIGMAGFGTDLANMFETASAPAPKTGTAQVAASNESSVVALQADSRGHFLTDASANNQFIRVLVDTGASMVALTAQDAQKIGLSEKDHRGVGTVSTANGVVKVVQVRIPELRLQGLTVRDVDGVIMPPRALGVTLLGMSFIKRLKSFEMQGRTLVLRQ